MKKLLIISIILFTASVSFAQRSPIIFGMGYGGDVYQRYVNPETEKDTTLRNAGNAILNTSLFVKLGAHLGNRFSITGEGGINWGATTFSLKEYKGMGSMAFPLIGKINIYFPSSDDDAFTMSFGGGVQYNKTELYGLTQEYQNISHRDFFQTYVGEFGLGLYSLGGEVNLYVRYGVGDQSASTFNAGISVFLDFNNLFRD